MAEPVTMLILLLLILCIGLLIWLLARQNAVLHHQEDSLLRQEHELSNLGNQLLDELDAQQDATEGSLYQANQNLMTTLSQIGQSQSSLLESMQRQVLLSTRNQGDGIGRVRSDLSNSLSRLDTQLDQLRESTQHALSSMRIENERQLTEMRKTVDEKLSENLEKQLNTSFSQVSERLESVYKGLGEMHALAAGVGDLKKVLTNVKTRGIWGEMQLSALSRQSLAPAEKRKPFGSPLTANFRRKAIFDWLRLRSAETRQEPKLRGRSCSAGCGRRRRKYPKNIFLRHLQQISPSCFFRLKGCMPKPCTRRSWLKASSASSGWLSPGPAPFPPC